MRKIKVRLDTEVLEVTFFHSLSVFHFVVSVIEEAVKQKKYNFLIAYMYGWDEKNPKKRIQMSDSINPIIGDRTEIKLSRPWVEWEKIRRNNVGWFVGKLCGLQEILWNSFVSTLFATPDEEYQINSMWGVWGPMQKQGRILIWAAQRGLSGVISTILKEHFMFIGNYWNKDYLGKEVIIPAVRIAIHEATIRGHFSVVKAILDMIYFHGNCEAIQERNGQYIKLKADFQKNCFLFRSKISVIDRYYFLENARKVNSFQLQVTHEFSKKNLEELFFLFQNDEEKMCPAPSDYLTTAKNVTGLQSFYPRVSIYDPTTREAKEVFLAFFETGEIFSFPANDNKIKETITLTHEGHYAVSLVKTLLLPILPIVFAQILPTPIIILIIEYYSVTSEDWFSMMESFLLAAQRMREEFLLPLLETLPSENRKPVIEEKKPGHKKIDALIVKNIISAIQKTKYFLETELKKQLIFHLKKYAHDGYKLESSSIYYAAFIKVCGEKQVFSTGVVPNENPVNLGS